MFSKWIFFKSRLNRMSVLVQEATYGSLKIQIGWFMRSGHEDSTWMKMDESDRYLLFFKTIRSTAILLMHLDFQ